MRIALGLEYDGSGFHGWQSQGRPTLPTVQESLQKAVTAIAGEPIAVVAAGRTDAGVHAVEQVVHFDTAVVRPLQAWVRGVNSYLPSSVAVRWAHEVDAQFHARYAAISRSYHYVLLNRPVRPALQHGHVGWFHRALDLESMTNASKCLLGEQDFSSFRSSECQAKSPVKTMHKVALSRHGDYIVFEFRAGGFLHHMVRNIVGSLLWIGYGKETPEWLGEVLAARDRTLAAPTFAPDGLYFLGAEYDPRWRLPQAGRIMVPFDSGQP